MRFEGAIYEIRAHSFIKNVSHRIIYKQNSEFKEKNRSNSICLTLANIMY